MPSDKSVNPLDSETSPLHFPQPANSLPRGREKAEKRGLDGRREARLVRFDSPKILPKIYEQAKQVPPLRAIVVVLHLLLDEEPVKLRETCAIQRPIYVGAVENLNVKQLLKLGRRKAPYLVRTEGNRRKIRC